MVLFLILLLLLILYQIHFNSFNDDYLGIEQSTAVKGIFAVIIFLSHERNYLTLNHGLGDALFNSIMTAIGQTMVVMFFFYSGYGIIESYKHKSDYKEKFFKNRIIKTLVHFDLAVLLYMLLNMIRGVKYPLAVNLLSLVGWASIGNSNWFICVILMLYVLTLAAFFISKKTSPEVVSFATLILSAVLWIALAKSSKPPYWYNTLMSYSAGMFFSVYKSSIDGFMLKNRNYYTVLALFSATLFACWIIKGGTFVYSFFSLIVSLLIVAFTMKVKMVNKYLCLLGKYSFSIYILHRIPMIIFNSAGIDNRYVFTALSFAVSCILAYVFDLLIHKLDMLLFARSNEKRN